MVFESDIDKQPEENRVYTLNRALRDYETKRQLYAMLCRDPTETAEQWLSIRVKAKKITYPNVY